MGSFLMMTCFLCTTISSGMFITAMAANPLAVNLAAETLGYTISWGGCGPGVPAGKQASSLVGRQAGRPRQQRQKRSQSWEPWLVEIPRRAHAACMLLSIVDR